MIEVLWIKMRKCLKKIQVKSLKFSSYIKSILLVSIASGGTFGIILLVLGIFGGDVEANVGTIRLIGISGGFAALIIGPLVFSIFGLIVSLLTFFPFKLMLKVIKKINIYGEFVGDDNSELDNSLEKGLRSKEE
jgi:hypothetical protein